MIVEFQRWLLSAGRWHTLSWRSDEVMQRHAGIQPQSLFNSTWTTWVACTRQIKLARTLQEWYFYLWSSMCEITQRKNNRLAKKDSTLRLVASLAMPVSASAPHTYDFLHTKIHINLHRHWICRVDGLVYHHLVYHLAVLVNFWAITFHLRNHLFSWCGCITEHPTSPLP